MSFMKCVVVIIFCVAGIASAKVESAEHIDLNPTTAPVTTYDTDNLASTTPTPTTATTDDEDHKLGLGSDIVDGLAAITNEGRPTHHNASNNTTNIWKEPDYVNDSLTRALVFISIVLVTSLLIASLCILHRPLTSSEMHESA